MPQRKLKTPPQESPDKLRPDVAETAYRVMLEATGQIPKTIPGERAKNPEAVKRGAKGGKKGGRARAQSLTVERRKEIAKRAGETRWEKKDT